ncbi:MAG TPA: hypothetical protein VHZ26_18370 [Caulobacteraceae bacterium]|jgi:hypothetical protein|nr:hypothetical protein [Caulobacteraceae bacterium]
MFRTTALALAIGALALPAVASTSITVSLSGLNARTAHTAIVRAAQTACRTELRDDSPLQLSYDWTECLTGAIAGAEANMPKEASLTQPRLASR